MRKSILIGNENKKWKCNLKWGKIRYFKYYDIKFYDALDKFIFDILTSSRIFYDYL